MDSDEWTRVPAVGRVDTEFGRQVKATRSSSFRIGPGSIFSERERNALHGLMRPLLEEYECSCFIEEMGLELESWAKEEWISGRARRWKWGPFKFSSGYDSVMVPLKDEAALTLVLTRWALAETWSMTVRSGHEEARLSKAGDSDYLEIAGSPRLAEQLVEQAESHEYLSRR